MFVFRLGIVYYFLFLLFGHMCLLVFAYTREELRFLWDELKKNHISTVICWGMRALTTTDARNISFVISSRVQIWPLHVNLFDVRFSEAEANVLKRIYTSHDSMFATMLRGQDDNSSQSWIEKNLPKLPKCEKMTLSSSLKVFYYVAFCNSCLLYAVWGVMENLLLHFISAPDMRSI